jgi:hypothetical protein
MIDAGELQGLCLTGSETLQLDDFQPSLDALKRERGYVQQDRIELLATTPDGEARRRKDAFAQDERTRKTEVVAELKASGQAWADEFRGWDADPHAVIDEWSLHEMTLRPSTYGLPRDRSAWPKPRELPTLW